MGKFVEWSDALSVGIEEIDEQHKMLVDLVNKMHEAIHQRHGSDVVKSILGDLAEYTRIHFAVEESLMRIL
ncbi:MAG: hemerythrin domain-containing protein, partial [Candidatus Thiodiazotropha taylori]